MKPKIIIAVVIIVLLVGGVYIGQRYAPKVSETGTTATSSMATSSQKSWIIPDQGEVTLGVGESAAFKGLIITPVEVVEDSRCPAGVYCIQAGTLRLKIYLSSDLGTSTMIMKLGGSVTTEAHTITLVSVDPLKTAAATITPKDYRFTLKVEKR